MPFIPADSSSTFARATSGILNLSLYLSLIPFELLLSWRSVFLRMCFLAFSHQHRRDFCSQLLTTFLTCIRGERLKLAKKRRKESLPHFSFRTRNHLCPGEESDTLTIDLSSRSLCFRICKSSKAVYKITSKLRSIKIGEQLFYF